ncbi:MAG TPA: MFS transporter [Acidobacteriota bacterium]|nr:MFS transporter [Acidobacteriota bacterium]
MPELKDSRQRWWLLALLISGMILAYAQRGALSIAAPFMMRDLGLSTGAMGLLLSAFFWSYSLMQVPAGWTVDRLGVRRAYAWGFALWSVASALTGFAHGMLGLIVTRVVLGVGQSAAFPASARAVSNWFKDRERGSVTAGYLTGVRLGQALISVAGVVFLSSLGYRLFFLIVGLAPLVWLVPWSQFLIRWEPMHSAADSGRLASTAPQITFLANLALLRQASVLGVFLGFFAYDYAWYVYVSWLPSYLMIERKFSAAEMGLYSSIPYLAMSATTLLSGFVSDALVRRGYSEVRVRKLLIVVGLLVTCLIVPAGLVQDKMRAVWLLTISIAGLGIAAPNTWTLTQSVCARNIVGTVSGIQNFGGNLGGILAPLLTGVIVSAAHSFSMALSLTGGILVLGMLSYCFLISRRIELEPDS